MADVRISKGPNGTWEVRFDFDSFRGCHDFGSLEDAMLSARRYSEDIELPSPKAWSPRGNHPARSTA
jgi:hypothetical protein